MNPLLDVAAGLATAGLLTGGYAYAANWPTSQLFGKTLITGPDATDGKHHIALTYDDGPSPRNTPALLDALAARNIRATFFLIGEHVRKQPDIARRVAAAGHVIGNHTTMHPNLAKQNAQRITEELGRCQKTLQDTLGVEAKLFRPPYGARTPSALKIARSMGLTPVMWNITAKDWEPIGAPAIQSRIDAGIEKNRRSHRASNVLLHDASHLDGAKPASRADTITVTRTLLQREDLRFVTPLDWL